MDNAGTSNIIVRLMIRETETDETYYQIWECAPVPGNFVRIEPLAGQVIDSVWVEAPQRLTPG